MQSLITELLWRMRPPRRGPLGAKEIDQRVREQTDWMRRY